MTTEEAFVFGPHGSQVGVLHRPPGAGDLAVIIVNAGLIHHVGPGRLHVALARALGGEGIASLRLDLSGVGDSGPRADHLSIFDLVRREPREAMDALAARGFGRFVVAGLCSGAYSAFHVACEDPRVVGSVVINPEDLARSAQDADGGEAQAQAWARRYWTHSLWRPRAWWNLLTGRVDYARLARTLASRLRGNGAAPDRHHALRQALTAGGHPVRWLFISSADDVSREYLDLLLDGPTLAALPPGRLSRLVLERCDHLFTRRDDQRRLIEALLPWLKAVDEAGRLAAQGGGATRVNSMSSK